MNHNLKGKDQMLSLAEKALAYSQAEQTEVSLLISNWALTRFANSYIHQNMASESQTVCVRVVFGKKVAAASCNMTDESSIQSLIDRAIEMARHQDDNPDFVSLPKPDIDSGALSKIPDKYSEATAHYTAEQGANFVRSVIAECENSGASAAGSLSICAFERVAVNSLGIRSYHRNTLARIVTVATGKDGGFGYASATSTDVTSLDPKTVGSEAAQTARASANPIEIEPSEYECVLSPYAVAEIVESFISMGFWARAFQEGRSFLCGKMGERIVHPSVNIWDDGLNPRTIVTPYDHEGIPKQRVDLVKDGIAAGLLYDSYAAHREGKKSTGHAGSFNPIMHPGDATLDQMIASTQHGLYVTRFHYTNVAHLMSASITGMTRDGTFLIEDGRITKPVKNMRFTQSLLEALANVEMIAQDLKLVDSTLVPAVKVKKWRFVSPTEF
ncbi:MAG: TldD/PmbA family protein [Armatimonadota bacterium]